MPFKEALSSSQFRPAAGGAALSHTRDVGGVRRGRGLSLRTLVILRWAALAGQTATITLAQVWLHFDLPVTACLTVVAAGALVNFAAMTRLNRQEGNLADGPQTALHLGFDILQLSLLLGLTGGLKNPFCLLLVAPVTVAAASLPARQAMLLGLMALIASAGLFLWAMPLPWVKGQPLELPYLYLLGIWLALVTGVVFTATYAWRVAADAEKLELALATTQDVLQREQKLAALGGLAAAAAHELGTPLATIQVVAKELLRESRSEGPIAEDARLLLQQADRCRDILKQLSQAPDTGDRLYADVSLKALLNEIAEPHRGFDLDFEILVRTPPGQETPRVRRLPEIIHGLSAFVENAADFAASRVRISAIVDAGWIVIEIVDDGPGISPDILPRLGEPYVTSRPQAKARRALAEQLRSATRGRRGEAPPPAEVAPSQGGMGLGFFIARTLMERTGGEVTVGAGDGGPGDNRGARVSVRWPRARLEPGLDQPVDLAADRRIH